MIPRILLLAALVAAPFTMAASLGGAFSVGVCGNLPCGSAIDTEPDGATPVFDTGDPETVTWGLLSSPPVAGLTLVGEWTTNSATQTTLYANTGPDLTAINGSQAVLTVQSPVVEPDGAFNNESYGVATPHAADLGTSDFWLQILARRTTANTGYMFDTNDVAAGTDGFYIQHLSSAYRCSLRANLTLYQATVTGTPALDAWDVWFCIADRDGYMVASGGATSDGAVDVSAGDGYTLNGTGMALGGRRGGANLFLGDIVHAQLYTCSGCLTVTGAGSYATEREAVRLEVLAGYKVPTGGLPSTATRASDAYLRKTDPTTDNTTYHKVVSNIPRREIAVGYQWDDPTASATTTAGFLQEAAATNIVNFGDALDNAAWTKINSATVDADQQNDPAGNATLDDIDGVSGSGEHGVSQAQTLTAASWVLSGAFRPGNQSFAYADVSSIANVSAYWDSSDCQPDTVGSAATAYGYKVRDSDDLCYVYLVFTGTAASHTHRLLCAEADGDKDYAGAAGDCAWGWVGLVAADGPHSPVITTSATDVTRSADALLWAGSVAAGPQTIIWDGTIPFAVSNGYLASVTGDADNRHVILETTSYGRGFGENAASNVLDTSGSTTSIVDNAHTIVRSRWAADDGELYVDGSSEATDTNTSGLDPPAADEVTVGQTRTGTGHSGASTWRLRVFEGSIAPGEQGTGDDTP